MLTCNSCNLDFPEDSVFCSKCGLKLKEKQVLVQQDLDQQEMLEPAQVNAENSTYLAKKKTSHKNKLIAVLIIALIAIAIPINNSFQENRKIAADELTAELESQSLTEAFDKDLLENNYADCSAIIAVMNTSTVALGKRDYVVDETKQIITGREALDYVNVNYISATALRVEYESSLDSVIYGALENIFLETDRDEKATVYQIATWKNQWKDAVLTKCTVLEHNTTLAAKLSELDSAVKRIISLADSVPWYPEGYKEFNSTTAFKFLKGGCDYFDCYNVALISKVSCSTMYAEMTIYDSSGANVSYSNDISSAVRPFEQVKMRFDVIESSAKTGRLTEVNCFQ